MWLYDFMKQKIVHIFNSFFNIYTFVKIFLVFNISEYHMCKESANHWLQNNCDFTILPDIIWQAVVAISKEKKKKIIWYNQSLELINMYIIREKLTSSFKTFHNMICCCFDFRLLTSEGNADFFKYQLHFKVCNSTLSAYFHLKVDLKAFECLIFIQKKLFLQTEQNDVFWVNENVLKLTMVQGITLNSKFSQQL
jgi:hypothetical protein